MPVWRLLRVHCGGADQRERLDGREYLLERDADLEARQVRAEAEVDPVAEGEMRVGITVQEERVRPGEAARVPIGRPLPDDDLLPGAYGLAAELARGGRRPPLGR